MGSTIRKAELKEGIPGCLLLISEHRIRDRISYYCHEFCEKHGISNRVYSLTTYLLSKQTLESAIKATLQELPNLGLVLFFCELDYVEFSDLVVHVSSETVTNILLKLLPSSCQVCKIYLYKPGCERACLVLKQTNVEVYTFDMAMGKFDKNR